MNDKPPGGHAAGGLPCTEFDDSFVAVCLDQGHHLLA